MSCLDIQILNASPLHEKKSWEAFGRVCVSDEEDMFFCEREVNHLQKLFISLLGSYSSIIYEVPFSYH